MSGKFNPSQANRADFEYLFWLAKEGIPALELQMSRIQSELTARINPLYDEVQNACGEYRNLGERLDAGDDALNAEESARTAADTSEAAARAAADTKHDTVLAGVIDGGAKNLLEMTQTQTTITRTSGSSSMTAIYDKAAGTVTLTGTHYSADSAFAFELYTGAATDTKDIPAGTYHLSGCVAGGSTSSYRAVLTGITGAVDTGNGATFTLAAPQYAAWRILVSGNCTLDGAVFKPMICLQAAWDISDKFVPYCPPPADLYEMIKALQSGSGTQAQLTSIRPVAGLTTDAAEPEDTEVLDDA